MCLLVWKCMIKQQYMSLIYTLILGVVSGFTAYYLGFPAPFLMGPAIAVTVVCVMGIKLSIPANLRDICFILIGISMGAGATPQVIDSLIKWPVSFVALAISMYLIMILGAKLLSKFFGFSQTSALLAATPGHLSFVIALSEDTGADTQKVALVQSMRLLALTLIVPIVLTLMDLSLPKTDFVNIVMQPKWVIFLAIGAAVVGFIFKKIKLPAAYLIGGMAVSTVFHLTSSVEGIMPQWAIVPAFIVMGCLIGTRFNGAKLANISSVLRPSLAFIIASFTITISAAFIVYEFTDLPLAQVLIAFTPGGVEAMIAMALLLNVDPTFVAGHHLMRLFILVGLLPWLMSRIKQSAN